MNPDSKKLNSRIVSLDQFRGYTMTGMFLVNFIGEFSLIPSVFKHNNTYCSYADTIMPHFFFAVGFAYRLAFLKRLQKGGDARTAYRHAIMRSMGLILIGIIMYHLGGRYRSWEQIRDAGVVQVLHQGFKALPWQALVHIGVTSLFVLPVIAKDKWVRVLFVSISAGLHILCSHLFYYQWVIDNRSIDGGPLGFMTYAIPTIVGSLAYDLMTAKGPRGSLRGLTIWGFVFGFLGYALSCTTTVLIANRGGLGLNTWLASVPFTEPSYMTDMWSMNQQVGSVSYLLFATGVSLWVYAFFVVLSDVRGFEIGVFRTFGTNALAGYLIHDFVIQAVHPLAPEDSPIWYLSLAFAVYFAITYFFIRHLEKNNIFFRL